MKVIVILTALSLSSAMAQFAWDEEPLADPVQAAVDRIDDAVRTPFIEPIRPIRPVIEPISVGCEATRLRSPISGVRPPAVPVVPWSRSPLARASGIDDSTRDPLPATSYGRSAVLSDSTRDPQPVTSYGRDAACPNYLGRLSANPYAVDSTANPYSPAGSPYSSTSVNNRFGPYGSPFSSTSARNPYATDAPDIVAQDGTYLGKLSDNPYDPNTGARSARDRSRMRDPQGDMSASEGVNSSQSPNNPYATQAPLLFGD
jgi:hypothetical protein